MDIGRSNDNFKDEKPKFFNYNKYGHMAKECQMMKKEQKIRECFKCDKEGHITKDWKGKQTMKNRKVQDKSDDKDNTKKEGFGNNLE